VVCGPIMLSVLTAVLVAHSAESHWDHQKLLDGVLENGLTREFNKKTLSHEAGEDGMELSDRLGQRTEAHLAKLQECLSMPEVEEILLGTKFKTGVDWPPAACYVKDNNISFIHIYKNGGTAISSTLAHRELDFVSVAFFHKHGPFYREEYEKKKKIATLQDPIYRFFSGFHEFSTRVMIMTDKEYSKYRKEGLGVNSGMGLEPPPGHNTTAHEWLREIIEEMKQNASGSSPLAYNYEYWNYHILPQFFFLLRNTDVGLALTRNLYALGAMDDINETMKLMTNGAVTEAPFVSHLSLKFGELPSEILNRFDLREEFAKGEIDDEMMKDLCRLQRVDYVCLNLEVPEICKEVYEAEPLNGNS